jgi:hypothetical protein
LGGPTKKAEPFADSARSLDFYENIAKEKLDKMLNVFGGKQLIPFQNMYFISVDDLDLLIECYRRKGTPTCH